LPSRTGDPAGATVGVAGLAGAADDWAGKERLDVLLELDDELEVLLSLLPHFPIAKRMTKIATTINATLPPPDFFVAAGAWGAAHPRPSQYI
jgi:hypothetical protein